MKNEYSSLFIESICFIDGEARLLRYHQDRVDRTFMIFFPDHDSLSLKGLVQNIPASGKFKCRIVYGEGHQSVEFIPYPNRKITALKLVESDQVDYAFKYLHRTQLEELYAKRESADDVIILKDGLVTDSYFANLAFYDGAVWWTPDTPLLKGVKRQYLLDRGEIKEKQILKADLLKFQKVSLINSMLDLGKVEVEISEIME